MTIQKNTPSKNYNLKIKGAGQLINNDCLVGMKNLPDQSIDLVLTDPPYGIADNKRTTFVGSKGGKPVTTAEAWGNDFQDNFGDVDGFWTWFKPFMAEMSRVTKDGGSIILFLDTKYQGHFVYLIEKEFGLKFRNNIYFTKSNSFTANVKGYAHSCEQAIWFTKGKLPFTYNNPMRELRKTNPNVFSGSVGSKETKHPCEKYKWMIDPLIERHSSENQLILDPFGGSASTLVYGIQKNRKVIAFEKSEKFFDIAKARIEKHNLDVKFFEPNKQKIENTTKIEPININEKLNGLDDSIKMKVSEFIDSLIKGKKDENLDDETFYDDASDTIRQLQQVKINVTNDYMTEKTRHTLKTLIIKLSKCAPNYYSDEVDRLASLDFKQKLYCDTKTKTAFNNTLKILCEKFMALQDGQKKQMVDV